MLDRDKKVVGVFVGFSCAASVRSSLTGSASNRRSRCRLFQSRSKGVEGDTRRAGL
jgi:hypothetical protein